MYLAGLAGMSEDDDRHGLGERIRRRRERLGLTIEMVADIGRISAGTWSRIENGGKVRRLSYGAVDRALGWPAGACMDFLRDGTEPEPVAPPEVPDSRPLLDELRRQIAELRRVMDDEFGDQNRPVREAAFGVLDAVVEQSTSNGADR